MFDLNEVSKLLKSGNEGDVVKKLKALTEELKNYTERLPKIGFRDRCILVHKDVDGNVVEVRDTGWQTNTITDIGIAEIVGLITAGVGGTAFGYVAIGTGTTPESASNTQLENETHRVSAVGLRTTTTITDDTMQLIATFNGYTGTEAITESGVFNASSGGVLLCRQTFSVLNVNWDNGDSLRVTWKVQVTRP